MQIKKRIKRLYPRFTLIESLQVAQSIQDNNAGQPFAKLDLAISIERSPVSGAFQGLISSSGHFGLTTGSYSANFVYM